jgi:hypothetical protein
MTVAVFDAAQERSRLALTDERPSMDSTAAIEGVADMGGLAARAVETVVS